MCQIFGIIKFGFIRNNMENKRFKNHLAENVFRFKYSQGPSDTLDALAERLVEDVCGTRWGTDRALMSEGDRKQLVEYIKKMQFMPGGRYIYYAGRKAKFFNNCYLLSGNPFWHPIYIFKAD